MTNTVMDTDHSVFIMRISDLLLEQQDVIHYNPWTTSPTLHIPELDIVHVDHPWQMPVFFLS